MSLDRYSLRKDKDIDAWRLQKEGASKATKIYETKAEALADLRSALGQNGGSVRIRKMDETIQEERTYPRSKDPKKYKG